MLGEIRKSFVEFSKNKFDYLYLFFQLIILSNLIKYFNGDRFLIINLFITIFVVIIKNKLNFNKLITISAIYVFLCIIPISFFGINETYIGFFIRLLTGYFIFSYFNNKIFDYFENLLFVLAYISILFFTVQLININFFNVFTSFSQLLLDKERMIPSEEGYSHKYFIVFLLNGWAYNRNSGFMWEPAAFGGVLIWAIIINLFKNKFNFNKRFAVFFIAGFTTFSVSALLALGVVGILYFSVKGLTLKRDTLILLILIFAFIYLLFYSSLFKNQFETIFKKIDKEPVNVERTLARKVEKENVSRIASIYVNFNYFKKFPLGYGMTEAKGEYYYLGSSPNGFMNLLVMWGVFGFCFIIYSFFKSADFLKKYYSNNLKWYSLLLVVFLFIIPFTGNPFYHYPFILGLITLPLSFDLKRKGNPQTK